MGCVQVRYPHKLPVKHQTMKKPFLNLSLIATILAFASFSTERPGAIIGTYGVPDADPSAIRLSIRADHTFSYQDRSKRENSRTVNGTWTSKGRKVVLQASTPARFHRIWFITDEGQAARSRKGLCYYLLCRME